MSQEEFEARKRGQDQFHALLHKGNYFVKQGDNDKAEHSYLEADKLAMGSSSETVSKGVLARFCEKIGKYEESLRYVDWFLSGLQEGSESWSRYTEMKKSLLQKIDARKRGELRIPETKQVKRQVSPIA